MGATRVARTLLSACVRRISCQRGQECPRYTCKIKVRRTQLQRGKMSDKKPVVVYGANGFSGRLIVEFLREYNVPFIAAGRSRARLEDVMSRVPGIETAQYEIVETQSSVEELSRLFEGAKVVCNTAGPFIYNGPR